MVFRSTFSIPLRKELDLKSSVFILRDESECTFGASAAPTGLAEVRMNEADKQERDNFYKVKDSKLRICYSVIIYYC